MTTIDLQDVPLTKGRVMRAEARYYDLLAWLLTLGRERPLRERLVELAQLAPGETVLDVGCGTGTLAIAAKRRVGAAGTVHGIDASIEMILLARRKAKKAGLQIEFKHAVVEALPFPDASFDTVLSTLMLHHLPRAVRRQCVVEMRRVLRPGGRVLAVDFASPDGERKGLLDRLHRHGHTAPDDIIALLRDADMRIVENGSVGVSKLYFVLGMARGPGDDGSADLREAVTRSLPPLPQPRWIVPVSILAVATVHLLLVGGVSVWQSLTALSLIGVAALVIGMHAGLLVSARSLFARRGRRKAP